MEKLEWLGYHIVKKFRRYLYSFCRNSRTWQTDGQTDGHRVPAIATLCIASHGRNSLASTLIQEHSVSNCRLYSGVWLLMTDDWSMIIHLFVLLPRSGDSNCFASPVFVCFCLFVCLFVCYDICYDVTTATWREKQLSCETFKIHCVSKKRAKCGKLYIVETTACWSWLVFETQCRRAMAKVLCH